MCIVSFNCSITVSSVVDLECNHLASYETDSPNASRCLECCSTCNLSPHAQTFHIGSIVLFRSLHAQFILISAAFDEPV